MSGTLEPSEMASLHADAPAKNEFQLLKSTACARDGTRLPTPERMAVIELADKHSEQKHRLRRQQQLLQDIAQKAREQDVTALSGALTKKCTLDQFGRKYERSGSTDVNSFQRFATNSSVVPVMPHQAPANNQRDSAKESTKNENANTVNNKDRNEYLVEIKAHKRSSPLVLEFGQTPTSFPLRRPKKTTTRGQAGNSQQSKDFPRLKISYTKGLLPNSTFTKHTIKASLIKSRHINGPIQLKHYIQPKDALAPLVLPDIKNTSPADLDRVDSFISSSRMKIGTRPRNPYDQGFMIGKPAFMMKMDSSRTQGSKKLDTPRLDSPSAWVTQSMATPSLAPSTSPTLRSKAVKSMVSYHGS